VNCFLCGLVLAGGEEERMMGSKERGREEQEGETEVSTGLKPTEMHPGPDQVPSGFELSLAPVRVPLSMSTQRETCRETCRQRDPASCAARRAGRPRPRWLVSHVEHRSSFPLVSHGTDPASTRTCETRAAGDRAVGRQRGYAWAAARPQEGNGAAIGIPRRSHPVRSSKASGELGSWPPTS
jgi:hypothetical protein